jgi:hypothetical protein
MRRFGLVLLMGSLSVLCRGQIHEHVWIHHPNEDVHKSDAMETLHERYFIDTGVSVDADRSGWQADGRDSYVLEVHALGNSTITTRQGFTLLDTAFQFGYWDDFDLLRFSDASALNVDSMLSAVADGFVQRFGGTRANLTYERPNVLPNYDGYGTWTVKSDRRFLYRGMDWLPVREVIFVRKAPPPAPNAYGLEDLSWGFRMIVDTRHHRAYQMSGMLTDWFDTLRVDE